MRLGALPRAMTHFGHSTLFMPPLSCSALPRCNMCRNTHKQSTGQVKTSIPFARETRRHSDHLASADSATGSGATSASSAAATSTSPEVLRGISRKKGGCSTHCIGTKAEFGKLTCLNVAVSPPRNSCCKWLLGSKQCQTRCQLRQN